MTPTLCVTIFLIEGVQGDPDQQVQNDPDRCSSFLQIKHPPTLALMKPPAPRLW